MQGWKTILFAVAIGGLGAIQEADLAAIINEENAGLAMIAIGAVIAILRKLTSTAIFKKE